MKLLASLAFAGSLALLTALGAATDDVYRLGPDSQPHEGVPRGRIIGPLGGMSEEVEPTDSTGTRSLRWTHRLLFVGPFENCTTADLNKDGHIDIVYGPYWFAGPDFVPRAYRANFIGDQYHRNNSDHVFDVDGDGWPDIIAGYWDANGIWWYKNPGNAAQESGRGWEMHHPWEAHQLASTRGRMEMFALHDYDGDGRPELHSASYARNEPLEIWRWTTNAEGKPALAPFVLGAEGGGHGFAFGDVNGNGRIDVLCEIGWYERPEGDPFAGPWKLHRETDLTKMHPSCPFVVKDLNEDGRLDIIFGRGHDYGLYWWEQLEPKPDGTTQWKQHVIDESWSQAHVLALADLDGDGQEELIAGKCIWAHDAGDPGATDPPAVYYYKWDRTTLTFIRHTIAAPGDGIALGRQFTVTDLNGNGRPDILAPGKHSFWILSSEGCKWSALPVVLPPPPRARPSSSERIEAMIMRRVLHYSKIYCHIRT